MMTINYWTHINCELLLVIYNFLGIFLKSEQGPALKITKNWSTGGNILAVEMISIYIYCKNDLLIKGSYTQ